MSHPPTRLSPPKRSHFRRLRTTGTGSFAISHGTSTFLPPLRVVLALFDLPGLTTLSCGYPSLYFFPGSIWKVWAAGTPDLYICPWVFAISFPKGGVPSLARSKGEEMRVQLVPKSPVSFVSLQNSCYFRNFFPLCFSVFMCLFSSFTFPLFVAIRRPGPSIRAPLLTT
ncbi:hypothetical protein C7212DRAFT_281965 [Tuber magnatum]|uniref:Uncharacterized protein n=1 Tax=Tuber magnatum TaxID=42249 RepID=A0A317SMI2_9PEZI|nr:hypothetical protein C7212DRAFT_281965 [Tuber magnatum]